MLEELKRKEEWLATASLTQKEVEEALGYVLQKSKENSEFWTKNFSAPNSEKLVYPSFENVEWTASFITGIYYLCYEMSGDDSYKKVLLAHLASFKERVEKRVVLEHHDIGFLYSLSTRPAILLWNDKEAEKTFIKAADILMERYLEKAGIIQAWGSLTDEENRGRMIIDCTMNLPLLYRATESTGNPKYAKVAYQHVKNSQTYLVREDSSTYHTYFMDVVTGKPRFGKTAQGAGDNSSWARGQAWAIYGFMLSYHFTHDQSLLATAKQLAHYFLNRLPADNICYWDLIFTDGEEERDSSSAVIAVCGLLEMMKVLPLTDSDRPVYQGAINAIMRSLISNYTTKGLNSNGLLQHAVYGKPQGNGIDECCSWGDYYYTEALVRLLKDWQSYW